MAANSNSPVQPAIKLVTPGTNYTSVTSATRARINNSDYQSHTGLHIAQLVINVNETVTVSGTGWVKAFQVNNGSTTLVCAVARGDVAADPTFTWTSAATGRLTMGYIDSPIDPFPSSAGDAVGVNNSNATGTGNPINLASIDSEGPLGLHLYSLAVAGSSATQNPPASWTEYMDNGSAQGNVTMGWKTYFEAAIASGSLTLTTSTSVTWVARLWNARVADALAGLTTNEMEIAVLGGLGPGLATTELEIAALLSLAPTPPSSANGRRLLLIN